MVLLTGGYILFRKLFLLLATFLMCLINVCITELLLRLLHSRQKRLLASCSSVPACITLFTVYRVSHWTHFRQILYWELF